MTTDQPGPDAASGSPPLNYYGELVRRQWEGCLPDVYQQIRDPGAFSAVLGQMIAQRIDELADHLAGDDQTSTGKVTSARLPASLPRANTRSNGCSGSTYCSRRTRTGRRSWIAATPHGRRSMPSSGNGSVIRPARRAGHDRARLSRSSAIPCGSTATRCRCGKA
jgi:hypothetical protein